MSDRIISISPTPEFASDTGHVRCWVIFERYNRVLNAWVRREEMQWVLA